MGKPMDFETKVQREIKRIGSVFLKVLAAEKIPDAGAVFVFPLFAAEWKRRARSGESRSIKAMRPIVREAMARMGNLFGK